MAAISNRRAKLSEEGITLNYPLYVAFVWHMHQPDYRIPAQNRYFLPWVRMHAVKDYLHVLEVLRQYPDIKATFNYVPVLVEQLERYVRGEASDLMMDLGRQDGWSAAEKQQILNLGYSINWDRIARRYPRYSELIDRRQAALQDGNSFSNQDYRDLITWFNLAWTDPVWLAQDNVLKTLVQKGRNFDKDDFEQLMAKQLQMCGLVVPTLREMAQKRQIEISTSPYYHPILPLLINSDIALRPSPGLSLPTPAFVAPEDAVAQVQRAVHFHHQTFGQPTRGLWPSEGAVAPEILPILDSAGLHWFASDEGILARSLKTSFQRDSQEQVSNPEQLYRAYRLPGANNGLAAIFRDRRLSDNIGFVYMHYPHHQAAEDLVVRLRNIRHRLDKQPGPFLVSIILDGENCWEYYEQNGDPFLHDLYRILSQTPELQTVTVSEYLDLHGTQSKLPHLDSGSWIMGDFTTWIGDPEHNVAWNLLRQTREDLEEALHGDNVPSAEQIDTAREALYSAEGSDWFWWYSHRNNSDQDAIFDKLFRQNLAAVYQAIGRPVPDRLRPPIYRGGRALEIAERVTPFATPKLTASADGNLYWRDAVALHPRLSTGTMQLSYAPLHTVRLAYNRENIYLRFELGEPVGRRTLIASFTGARGNLGNLLIRGAGQIEFWHYGRKTKIHPPLAASGRVIEIALPLNVLQINLEDTVGVRCGLQGDNGLFSPVPDSRPYLLQLTIPQQGQAEEK